MARTDPPRMTRTEDFAVESSPSDEIHLPMGAPGPSLRAMYDVHGVTVDPEARRVWRDGSEIVLSRKEFDFLHYLVSHAGEIVDKPTLMRDVWKTEFWTSSKTIDVHLGWLRRKLGDDPKHPALITTHRGRGLRFEVAPAPVLATD